MPDETNIKIGFAFTGSFCTFDKVISELSKLSRKFDDITPLMSPAAFSTDTRFGTAESFKEKIRAICKKDIISTISQAEPVGPKKLFDILIIAPLP